MGLGRDPRQQQLPPAKLSQVFGGRATDLEGVWEIPSGGRWSQIGLCALRLRVAGAQRKQSCKELASAEFWGW